MTTEIEWTQRPGTIGETWNPTRGCRRISPGCERCYAERQANRFKGKGGPYEGLVRLGKGGPRWTGKGLFVDTMLALPLFWRMPRTVFVDSMSDLFYEAFSNYEIAAIFGVMAATPQHIYQILTKRAERMRAFFGWADGLACHGNTTREVLRGYAIAAIEKLGMSMPLRARERALKLLKGFDTGPWPLPNVWLGVSVEDQDFAKLRVPELIETPAAVRFVSYEPALGPVSFMDWVRPSSAKIDWVIVGGESGPRARAFDIQWAYSVLAQCRSTPTRVFVKQLGSNAHDSMRSMVVGAGPGDPPPNTRVVLKDTKGGDAVEWPERLRVREWPEVRA